MSGRGLLDADMSTLGRWIAQGWHWWLEELRGLVPARLRSGRRDNLPRFVFQGGALVPEERKRSDPGGTRVTVVIPARLCLVRIIERPATSERDLQRMLAFEGETILPFPPGATILAGRSLGPAISGRMRIEVAGLPTAIAREIGALALDAGVRPVRVLVQEDHASRQPLDFAPAMREAGLLPKLRSATPLVWALVGFLLVLNLGMMIWRDTASVARLEQIVQDQQPAVLVAQTMIRRTDQDRALVARTLALRGDHNPLGSLAAVSQALPDGVWLQRYVWDGPTLRLTGYKPAKMDVATALRRSGRFAEVKSTSDETQPAVPAGEPFDVAARIIRK